MTRTRVRRRRTTLVLGGVLVAGIVTGPLSEALGDPSRAVPGARERYVVRSGDTLWSIAGRVAPDRDPRPVVDAMVEANGIDPGALVPGQSLVVPSVG